MCYFVTYSHNRIRFKFPMTRSGEPTTLVNKCSCRLHTVCVHIRLHDTLHEIGHNRCTLREKC